MLVKCFKCKEKHDKEEMVMYEVKKPRRYFHKECYEMFIKEQEQREKDLMELDELYQYLLRLHNINLLDGRMMEKIQDLRNGSIKINGKKIKKYKQGVSYSLMLETYKHFDQRIDYIIHSNQFQTKWNEFSYVFGTMVNNINTVKELNKRVQQVNKPVQINQETVEIEVKKANVKDDLDISEFL